MGDISNSALKGVVIIEGHVQGLSNTRSLGEAGIPVIVVDKVNCIARYSKYCQRFFRSPDFLNDEFVPFLIELAKNEKLKDWVLIPSNDHAVYSISKSKFELEKFYKVITPSIEIINKIYDKSELLNIARESNVPVPATAYFSSLQDIVNQKLSFPVLTKGRFGLTFYKLIGKKVLLSRNVLELKNHLIFISKKYSIEKTITQELIPFEGSNKTISFTAFCDNGVIKTYWIGKKLREHPLRFGTATFCESIRQPELMDLSSRLLEKLKYTGVCEIEYLFDPRDNKFKLIEMNARTWLWVGLAKACGIDYVTTIYNFAIENRVVYSDKYVIGLKWINWLTDIPYSILAIISGKTTISDYIGSLRGHKVKAIFKKTDIKPLFAYAGLSFTFLKSR